MSAVTETAVAGLVGLLAMREAREWLLIARAWHTPPPAQDPATAARATQAAAAGMAGRRAGEARAPAILAVVPDTGIASPAASGWLTTAQVAAELGIHKRTVPHWADKGVLTARRTRDGYRLYDPASVQARKEAMTGDLS